jgi:5-methylcytosine-specific restriction endonuclease McrBC GTP-binding regulatory subunit McrB
LTKNKEVVRTTFHPDSDYSTFVGAYKPTSIEIPVRDVTGKVIVEDGNQVTENRIVYEFVEQAFLQAYIKAWNAYINASEGEKPEDIYLVIEEINRGNCAQIFGDLFQLLDRNGAGFSDYPIQADKDMKKQLAKAFKGKTIADAERINDIYEKDIVAQVLSGEKLLLPDNLYIWATMNTSDQSLFPIDSAFKRRWDWQYTPICEGKSNDGQPLGWKIKANDKEYDWWEFVQKINDEIDELTKSEDKKLGYFFCKPANGIISAETFVGKVVFYLWNDVFKDQDMGSIFHDKEDKELTFNSFYGVDAYGKAVVQENVVEIFLNNLKLTPVGVEVTETNLGE